MRASECFFHLVLLVRPFTHLLPARIASMVNTKQSSKTFFDTAIGDFSSGHFLNKLLNDW